MPRHAELESGFFKDPDIKTLLEENHDAVLLYLYYTINCPNLLGIYQSDDKDDRVSIRYPLKKFKKARNSILKSGKIVSEEGWVWVVGKGNRIKGRKQWICARKLLRELPKGLKLKEQFIQKYKHLAIGYQCPIDGASTVALPIPIPIPKERDKTIPPDFLQRVEKLKTLILQNNPSAKVKDEKWGDVVRLMVERDSRTLEEIDELIEWSQGEEFEKTIILSMKKVREHFDRMTMKKKKLERGRESNICPDCRKPMASDFTQEMGACWYCTDCRRRHKRAV